MKAPARPSSQPRPSKQQSTKPKQLQTPQTNKRQSNAPKRAKKETKVIKSNDAPVAVMDKYQARQNFQQPVMHNNLMNQDMQHLE